MKNSRNKAQSVALSEKYPSRIMWYYENENKFRTESLKSL